MVDLRVWGLGECTIASHGGQVLGILGQVPDPCMGTPHVAGARQSVQIAEAEGPRGGVTVGRQGIWSEEPEWIVRQSPQPHPTMQQATPVFPSGYPPKGEGHPSAAGQPQAHNPARAATTHCPALQTQSDHDNLPQPGIASARATGAAGPQLPQSGLRGPQAQATMQEVADPAGIAPSDPLHQQISDQYECTHSNYVLATVHYADSWTYVKCRDMHGIAAAPQAPIYSQSRAGHYDSGSGADPTSTCVIFLGAGLERSWELCSV